MSLLLLFRPRGSGGPPPPPVVIAPVPAGGDSTRLRRRTRKAKLRYWWEKDDPKALEQGLERITVLSAEEALLDPLAVEALWEEKAALNDFIVEMSVKRVNQRVVAKLEQVGQYLQARMDAEVARKRRIKKKIMLLLGGD